ncbi:ATP-binding protein [Streptomyces spiramenti]|uniref:ATP-binding protein n=1 Tax=Streptomyces spiramenti TaxID=2720606 RepID=A0ABX1AJD5_9ACTN|nr:ATP-binding protein [Streptomyces spiramenti]NJP65959.1 ATP-binding protein [Streptomyces spiramenti]
MDTDHPAPDGHESRDNGGGPRRPAELIAGDFLLTLNPVDGSQIESCPPGRRPVAGRSFPDPSVPGPRPVLLEREDQRERLARLLSRGRSVRLTGPAGSGRTALLDGVARDCADLAPDGLIRLSGHHRTATDIKHELYGAAHDAPGHRPAPAELRAALRGVGAVVLVDDVEFTGNALEELLDATPECAFLLTATPGSHGAGADSRLEEIVLGGLSRTGCLELLENLAGRPLTDEESDWAGDLWSATEGLPVRFAQAGELLRLRDGGRAPGPLPEPGDLVAALAAALPEGARETLRIAVALGGALPAAAQLPALTGDHTVLADHDRLHGAGLLSTTGDHVRIAGGVGRALAAAGYAEGASERALGAAQHYAWWLSDADPGPRPVAAEAETLLAVARAAQRAGHHEAVASLVRAAAPKLAQALRWGVWERMLRTGQECARAAGFVADQAYFHHELGVLAICRDQLDRARAELEASVALRAALADSGGVHAGRRALALVEDLVLPAQTPATAVHPVAVPEKAPSAPGADTVMIPRGSEDSTQVITAVSGVQPPEQPRGGLRKAALAGTRRNTVAAGTGVLLAAVLGTVVTLGLTSGETDLPDTRPRGTDDPTSAPDVDGTDDEEVPTREAEEPRDEEDGDDAGEQGDPSPENTPEDPDPSPESPEADGSEEPGDDAPPADGNGGGAAGGNGGGTGPGSPGGDGGSGNGGGTGNGGGGGNGGNGGSGGNGGGAPDPTSPDPDPTSPDPDPTSPDPDPTSPDPDPTSPDPDPTSPDPDPTSPGASPSSTAPTGPPSPTSSSGFYDL